MLVTNLGMIFAGSLTTIFGKVLENPVDIKRGDTIERSDFKHPLILSFLMFAGESLMLLLF